MNIDRIENSIVYRKAIKKLLDLNNASDGLDLALDSNLTLEESVKRFIEDNFTRVTALVDNRTLDYKLQREFIVASGLVKIRHIYRDNPSRASSNDKTVCPDTQQFAQLLFNDLHYYIATSRDNCWSLRVILDDNTKEFIDRLIVDYTTRASSDGEKTTLNLDDIVNDLFDP